MIPVPAGIIKIYLKSKFMSDSPFTVLNYNEFHIKSNCPSKTITLYVFKHIKQTFACESTLDESLKNRYTILQDREMTKAETIV